MVVTPRGRNQPHLNVFDKGKKDEADGTVTSNLKFVTRKCSGYMPKEPAILTPTKSAVSGRLLSS